MDTNRTHEAMDAKHDVEKNLPDTKRETESISKGSTASGNIFLRLSKRLLSSVEARGIVPVPIEERTDRKGTNLFSLWFTANCSLLPVATGFAGTYVYGLSLQDSSLIILFFSSVFMVPVAFMGTMGPKTGMRQMIQARYSFGLYLNTILVLLQLALITGYTIITSIISGQTLAAVSGGSLSLSVGIVVTALLGLFVSFCGYRVLHLYEQYSWIPTIIALVVACGYGGKNLALQTVTSPATVRQVLSFASIVCSLTISWAPLVSDFAVYVSPDVPRARIFSYVYIGLLLPTIPLLVLGAAIGGAVPNVASWNAANEAYSTGGVMYAMVARAGGFGKFVAILLAFSVIGNVACSLYSISISLGVLLPFLVRVPRYVFSIVITAIVIPISIVVASNFLSSLGNFLGLIGYWAAAYIGIALTEYQWFRKASPERYDPTIFDNSKKLPVGTAAVAALALSFGLIVPCMDAAWYTGPIAMHTGDIGVEVGMILSALLYLPLRTLEIRLFGR